MEPISAAELETLIRLAKKVMWCDEDLKRVINSHGLHIIPPRFYCEIPTVEDIDNSFEFKEIETGAFNSPNIFKPDTIKDFIQKIGKYAKEFAPPLEGDVNNPSGFFWRNPAFSHSDAMAYYCIIRYLKPKRILEIGSGFSTLVADQALRKNNQGSLFIIEPYPKEFLKKLPTVEKIKESFVQDLPVKDLVDWIEEGDIWFIDSTHTVKNGSDCLYIYLKVMPEIKKKILVHSHDIHLPFPFSRQRLIEKNITWTEQYLLYAYLLDNPKTEVLFSSTYCYRFLKEELTNLMMSKYSSGGGSLWYLLNR